MAKCKLCYHESEKLDEDGVCNRCRFLYHPFSGLQTANRERYKERVDLLNSYDPFSFLKSNLLKKKR